MTPFDRLSFTVVEPGFELSPYNHFEELALACEWAGRTCYKSEDLITDDSAPRFCSGLLKRKPPHESVIEHAVLTAKIICSRSCSHQLVRHRIAAYSQESQRYCDYGKKGLQIICPPSIGVPAGLYTVRQSQTSDTLLCDPHLQDRGQRAYLYQAFRAYGQYLRYREAGIPAEDAREVLPNAVKTEVVSTFNLRTWRHIFRERALNPRAQWQIRGIFLGLLDVFVEKAPSLFADLLETDN